MTSPFEGLQKSLTGFSDTVSGIAKDAEAKKRQQILDDRQAKIDAQNAQLFKWKEDDRANVLKKEQDAKIAAGNLQSAADIVSKKTIGQDDLLGQYIPQNEQSKIDALVADKAAKGETVTEQEIRGLFGTDAGERGRQEMLAGLPLEQRVLVEQYAKNKATQDTAADLTTILNTKYDKPDDKVKALSGLYKAAANDPRGVDITKISAMMPKAPDYDSVKFSRKLANGDIETVETRSPAEEKALQDAGYNRGTLKAGKGGSGSGNAVLGEKDFVKALTAISPDQWSGGDRTDALTEVNKHRAALAAAGVPKAKQIDIITQALQFASGQTDWTNDDVEFDDDRFQNYIDIAMKGFDGARPVTDQKKPVVKEEIVPDNKVLPKETVQKKVLPVSQYSGNRDTSTFMELLKKSKEKKVNDGNAQALLDELGKTIQGL